MLFRNELLALYGIPGAICHITLLLLLLCLAGCASSSHSFYTKAPEPLPIQVNPWRVIDRTPPGKPGGILRVSEFGSDPKTFNPITANETSSTDIISQIFSSLLDVNFKTGAVVPGLAYQWSHSKDNKTWIVRLRKGLRWSDGMPLTADDVVFTFRAIYDPRVDNPGRDIAQVHGKPIQCEKINETTIRFTLPDTYGPFPYLMASIGVIPKHKLEAALNNGTFSSAYGVNTPPREIVGDGPFRVAEYVSQQRVTLERNPYFYAVDVKGQRLPYLDRIVVLYVPDMNTQYLKFISGEIDVLSQFPPKFYDDLKAGEQRGNYRVLNLGPRPETQFIVFNENPNPKILNPMKYRWFSNEKFRQAIAYAVNRKAMIRLAYQGLGYAVTQDFQPGSPFYNHHIKPFPYDPEKAKTLLEEAGFHRQNGTLYDRQNNPVQFTLLTNSGNAEREIMGELIKADLAKLGIDVDFHPIDFNQLVTELDHTFNYDAILLGLVDAGGSIEPSSDQNVWLSSGFTHQWNPRQKKPATPWEAEIDQLVWKGLETLQVKERQKIYGRIEEILYAQAVPMVPLAVPANLYAFRNRIGNADPAGMGGFWNGPDDMLMCQVYIKDSTR